ncbi:MAG: NADH-quinone oxidoreductase subunit F [Actinobacteria bacterium]|nr:NADH-quinone oxidoreductase subunit F [Actinomycetota bacterium]
MSKLTPVLSAHWDQKDSFTFSGYKGNGGYKALEKALAMEPDAVIQSVKDSGLRGRGGAGFPTGMKWGFIPQGDNKEHYFVVNADESEPGTCKDTPLMMANPHVLIEGIIIGSYAIRANHAFIYIRGEVAHVIRRVQQAIEDAYKAGYLGKNILGKGFDLELVLHVGAGAYICGEETALLDSLEGFRGQPRLRPPFPAIAGLYARPTIVNNVETVASVPSIIENGPEWFAAIGTEKSKGYTLYSLSGHVNNPGQFEAPLGITLRTPLDYEGVSAAGSMLGTKALQIFDETTCIVRAVLRWTEFYKHESCGKCTPCREGTWWLVQILKDLEHGKGTAEDLDKLLDLCDNIMGRSFCALADGAASPIISSIQYFKDEYLQHLAIGGCPFDAEASTKFVTSNVGGVK